MAKTKTTSQPDFKLYPEIGRTYLHYKGGKYKVLTMAKHSETNEDLIVYQSLHWGNFYVRPLHMWFEIVTNHKKQKVQRFALIS